MKNLFFLAISLTLFASCNLIDSLNNENEKANPCQIVSADLVPQVVKDSLSARYPGVVPIKWLNKDNIAFCVNFVFNDTNEVIAIFSNSGNFIKQEENVNVEQTGQHTDNESEDLGCECEVEDSKN